MKDVELVRRCSGQTVSQKATLLTYTSLIRSVTIYSCQVWVPIMKSDIRRNASIQRKAKTYVWNLGIKSGCFLYGKTDNM